MRQVVTWLGQELHHVRSWTGPTGHETVELSERPAVFESGLTVRIHQVVVIEPTASLGQWHWLMSRFINREERAHEALCSRLPTDRHLD